MNAVLAACFAEGFVHVEIVEVTIPAGVWAALGAGLLPLLAVTVVLVVLFGRSRDTEDG
jgi:hypothetical protein